MKEFEVSLDIVSDVLALAELSGILQHPPESGSHSLGDRRTARAGAFSESLWSLRSKAPATAPIDQHFRSIRSQFSPERLLALTRGEKSGIKEVFIDIGVFFEVDTFPQIILTREDLKFIEEYEASLRVVCYPWSAQEE